MDGLFTVFSAANHMQNAVLLVAGIIFTGLGGFIGYLTYSFRSNCIESVGKVVFIIKDTGKKSQAMYTPVFEYTAPNGEVVRFKHYISSSAVGKYVPNLTVPILYHKDNIYNARVKGNGAIAFSSIFLAIGFGLILFYFIVFGFNILGLLAVPLFLGYLFIFKLKRKSNAPSVMDAIQNVHHKSTEIPEESDTITYLISTDLPTIKKSAKGNKTGLAVGTGVLAPAMIIGGIVWMNNHNAFMRIAVTAYGEVVGMDEKYDSDSGYTYYPKVRFETDDAQSITFKSNVGSNPPIYHVGDYVDVLYNPQNPNENMIDRGMWNYLPQVILMFFGVIIGLISIKTALSLRKKN